MLKLVFNSLSNRLFIMLIIIFILLEFSITRKLILKNDTSKKDTLILALIFGSLGIIGTFWGVNIENSIANSRIIGVFVGGIVGGPVVGTLAGILAGSHRYLIDIGGFTAFSCALSTVLGGIIAGQLSGKYKRSKNKVIFSLVSAMLVESLQMLIIIVLAGFSEEAFSLVKVIGLPMVISNAIGISIFLLIIDRMISEKERNKALQTQIAFNIANDSSFYFKEGYSAETSAAVADIIIEQTSFSSITFTDKKHVIASSGCLNIMDYYEGKLDGLSLSQLKQRFYQESKVSNYNTYIEAIKVHDISIGYILATSRHDNLEYDSQAVLLESIANLLSTQIELSEVAEQRELLNQAELKALQAQINPHFLFNALNTINILIKNDPAEARRILLHLSNYFRSNINNSHNEVSLSRELEHVISYVEIEKARFQDKLKVVYNTPDNIDCSLPELIIQPLVENAVKHGICNKIGNGTVYITVEDFNTYTNITISDDGVGMNEKTLENLFEDDGSDKIGLKNVNQRLIKRYGNEYGLKIESKFNKGTRVSLNVPKKGEYYVEMSNS